MVGTLCKCKLKQNDFKSFLTDIQLNTAQQQKYINIQTDFVFTNKCSHGNGTVDEI